MEDRRNYAGGQRVAQRTGVAPVQYLFSDHLGSTALVTDNNLGLVSEMRYNPWGGVRYTSGAAPADNAYTYTGQRQEADLGLMFYNARWYDPYLNQFLTPDSIIPDPYNPLDYDRYTYARNNPVKYNDPSGHAMSVPLNAGCSDDQKCLRQANEIALFAFKSTEEINNPINNFQQNQNSQLTPNITISANPDTKVTIGANPNSEVAQGGNKEPLSTSSTATIIGAGLSGAASANYLNGGVEYLLLPDGTIAMYKYSGEGNSFGLGASGSPYIGGAYNIKSASDYAGLTSAVNATVATPEGGVVITYFWSTNDGPFGQENVKGWTIGPAIGAQISIGYSQVYYQDPIILLKK